MQVHKEQNLKSDLHSSQIFHYQSKDNIYKPAAPFKVSLQRKYNELQLKVMQQIQTES